ncbi:hypothetical protein BN137_2809 [Cronobacter condimenti 1330]|uniref:Uncharacterized protein n=1 Tax=Cronobacter condimenti 1330 TaxID=1073999 RepID=K8AGQ4_9ENTR|nr:hypothetical protein BN137_2809 [Cronobacter condimenti 1330]
MRISAQILSRAAGEKRRFLSRKQALSEAKTVRRVFYYSPQLIYEQTP